LLFYNPIDTQKIVVMGDIHGGTFIASNYRRAKTANDKLIFLGDYVDGWSQSLK
jgi:serine/threonine protein phosphatase 1